MTGKEFAKDTQKRFEVLIVSGMLAVGAFVVANQAELIGDVNSDEPTVDCTENDLKDVYIPKGGSWDKAAESVDMGPGVLQGDVAKVIEKINGTPIAPADEYADVPVACETAD